MHACDEALHQPLHYCVLVCERVGAYGCKVAFVCQTMWIWLLLLFKITKMCHTFDYIWLGKFKSKAVVVHHDVQVSLTISIQYTETPLLVKALSIVFFPLLIITWILFTASEVLKHWNINAETIKNKLINRKNNKLSDYWFPYMDAVIFFQVLAIQALSW